MRKLLLTSVAATALLAGLTAANAQRVDQQGDRPPAASSQQHPGTAGADEHKGKAGNQSQRTEDKGGQAGQAGGRQTTGAGGSEDRRPQGAQRGDRLDGGRNAQPGAGAGRPDKGASQGAQQQDKAKGAQKSQGPQPDDKSKGAQKSGTPGDMKRETTGSSQGAQQGEQGEKKSTQPPRSSSQKSDDKRSTTGQAPSGAQPANRDQERMNRDQSGRTREPGADRSRDQSGQGAPSGRSEQDQAGSRRDTQGSTSSSVNVTQEQQTKITEVISKQKVQPVTNVNFSVSIGAPVPRSVRAYDLPREIVQINPEFRGKKFVVVRDEIVIIEPRTYKVVTVIPRSGRSTTGTSTSVRQTTSSKLQLAPEKRLIIKEIVLKERQMPRCEDVRLSVGEELPRTIEVRTFSDEIVREVPEIRSYRFCVKESEVVLVDPNEYRIVEVID